MVWRRRKCHRQRSHVPVAGYFYKNALYEISKTSPNRTAIALEMGRLPLSMSEMQFCVVPNFSASSCCVHSIFPRNPRKAIAGEPSGKTSLALNTSSPSSFNWRTLSPAKGSIPRMASRIAPALPEGMERLISVCPLQPEDILTSAFILCLLFEPAVIHTAVGTGIAYFDYPDFPVQHFPHNDIARTTTVQVTMVNILAADNQAVIPPVRLFRAFIFHIKLQGVHSLPDVSRKFTHLLLGFARKVHNSECVVLWVFHAKNISIFAILSMYIF